MPIKPLDHVEQHLQAVLEAFDRTDEHREHIAAMRAEIDNEAATICSTLDIGVDTETGRTIYRLLQRGHDYRARVLKLIFLSKMKGDDE